MWTAEITYSLPDSYGIDEVAESAGNLLDSLEGVAGSMAPIVTGSVAGNAPVLTVSLDLEIEEPAAAISTALGIVRGEARRLDIPLAQVETILVKHSEFSGNVAAIA